MNFILKTSVFFLSSFIALTYLTACSGVGGADKDIEKMYTGKTAADIYQSAETELAKHNYSQAAKNYEALDTLYPANPYGEQAALDKVYAYYKSENSDQTTSAADQFIQRYPNSQQLAYVYYLKGLTHFRPDHGLFGKYFALNDAARDPGKQDDAYRNLTIVVEKFPKSTYASDAHQRLIYLRNIFAERELRVARFYLRQKNYHAASLRANDILLHYQQTASVEMALAVLVHAYQHLGLTEKSQQTEQLLHKNFPQSTALNDVMQRLQ